MPRVNPVVPPEPDGLLYDGGDLHNGKTTSWQHPTLRTTVYTGSCHKLTPFPTDQGCSLTQQGQGVLQMIVIASMCRTSTLGYSPKGLRVSTTANLRG